ncbi:MAG: hypothetical protein PHD61_06550 [Bacteroidales bacterium]|nr:hypothetical protein [Lentimicrobiaceae bacterium]MDD5694948.1 hypothetical protein [Bacteroidales bacterium]
MQSPFIRFLIRLSVFTLFAGLVFGLIYVLLPTGYASVAIPYQFLFFYLVTLCVHYYLLKAVQKSPASFVTRFMLVSFLKLLLYVIVLVIYLLLNKEDALRFTIPYLILYVLFSSFEIYSFLRISKSCPNDQQEIKP